MIKNVDISKILASDLSGYYNQMYPLKRLFKSQDIKLNDCKHINLIVGDNEIGKSAILDLIGTIKPRLLYNCFVSADNGRGYPMLKTSEKIATIERRLLEIADCNKKGKDYNNLILFDDIEQGLHYSKLKPLWRKLMVASYQNNLQIFATTHSRECIEYMIEVYQDLMQEKEFAEFKDSIRLYRIQQKPDNTKITVSYNAQDLCDLVEFQGEAR